MRVARQAKSLPGLSPHLASGKVQGRTTVPRQAVSRLGLCVLPAHGPARSAPLLGIERRSCAAPCAMLYEARAGGTIRAPLPSGAPLYQHQTQGQKGSGGAMAGPLL